jgi:hypothetical protein
MSASLAQINKANRRARRSPSPVASAVPDVEMLPDDAGGGGGVAMAPFSSAGDPAALHRPLSSRRLRSLDTYRSSAVLARARDPVIEVPVGGGGASDTRGSVGSHAVQRSHVASPSTQRGPATRADDAAALRRIAREGYSEDDDEQSSIERGEGGEGMRPIWSRADGMEPPPVLMLPSHHQHQRNDSTMASPQADDEEASTDDAPSEDDKVVGSWREREAFRLSAGHKSPLWLPSDVDAAATSKGGAASPAAPASPSLKPASGNGDAAAPSLSLSRKIMDSVSSSLEIARRAVSSPRKGSRSPTPSSSATPQGRTGSMTSQGSDGGGGGAVGSAVGNGSSSVRGGGANGVGGPSSRVPGSPARVAVSHSEYSNPLVPPLALPGAAATRAYGPTAAAGGGPVGGAGAGAGGAPHLRSHKSWSHSPAGTAAGVPAPLVVPPPPLPSHGANGLRSTSSSRSVGAGVGVGVGIGVPQSPQAHRTASPLSRERPAPATAAVAAAAPRVVPPHLRRAR